MFSKPEKNKKNFLTNFIERINLFLLWKKTPQPTLFGGVNTFRLSGKIGAFVMNAGKKVCQFSVAAKPLALSPTARLSPTSYTMAFVI